MESNAAGMVLRLALKTRFREIGWGSTPLLSAKFLLGYSLVWPKATVFEIVITGSNPVTSAKLVLI